MKKRRWIRVAIILVVFFVALNVVAYRHAWRMTHFVGMGARTHAPQKLGVMQKVAVLVRGVTVPKFVNESAPRHPYRTVYFTTRDGLRLEAWDIPAEKEGGPVVVMFHGYATGKSVMRGQMEVLRELGCRCVLVDFRGSGGSEGTKTSLGWWEALDVRAATEWVKGPVILYGQSLGAAAVLRAVAVEEVKPAEMILEAPYDRLVRTVGHRYEAMHLPAWPFARLLVFWGGVQQRFDAGSLNPVEYARSVECPALVLTGVADPWVKVSEARAVADAMDGRGSLHIFREAGHADYVRKSGDEYRQAVGEWLEKVHAVRGF